LAGGREGGFGLVEEVEAVAGEAIFQERDEGLPVGLFVEGFATVSFDEGRVVGAQRWDGVEAFDFGGDVEVGLGAEKETGAWALLAAGETNVAVELGMRGAGVKVEVARAAFGVEAGGDGEGFEEGGFAAAVFADDESDGAVEWERLERADGREVERVGVEGRDAVAKERRMEQKAAVGEDGIPRARRAGWRRRATSGAVVCSGISRRV
jgi:hypothetical protein